MYCVIITEKFIGTAMKNIYQKILTKQKVPTNIGQHRINTIDMHTGGEPLRVILDGFPILKGKHVLDYRRDCRDNYDHLRTALMFEPRGHADMYGCLLLPPNDDGAAFSTVFMHNEGYSTMCGHAIIALSTLAVQMDWIDVVAGDNKLYIDAPCGRIAATVVVKNQQVSTVKFLNVPSFVVGLDRCVDVAGIGEVVYDLAYGGAFYAYVDMAKNDFNFALGSDDYRKIIAVGSDIKQAVMATDKGIVHPFEDDLSFLYGTIFVDNTPQTSGADSKNVCVFAAGEVDRSPTGSGVSGRMAIHHARGEIGIGEKSTIESISGSTFTASVAETLSYGEHAAVIPQVEGQAFISGEHTFIIDADDPMQNGFILR